MRTATWLALVGGILMALSLGAADEANAPLEPIRIKDQGERNQKLEITNSSFSGSLFTNCRAEGVKFSDAAMPGLSFENANLSQIRFQNVNLSGGRIQDANLSDLKIQGAQLGGALFRHIGLPPPGAPAHEPGAKQRPLRFEECDLQGSTVKASDLSGVAISGCTMRGMTIDGVSVEKMLAAYRKSAGAAGATAGKSPKN
jgi:uncharacterized protein YjbI with pentapeptide repeats